MLSANLVAGDWEQKRKWVKCLLLNKMYVQEVLWVSCLPCGAQQSRGETQTAQGGLRLEECCGHGFPGLHLLCPSWRSSTDTLVMCVRTVPLSLQISLLLLYKKKGTPWNNSDSVALTGVQCLACKEMLRHPTKVPLIPRRSFFLVLSGSFPFWTSAKFEGCLLELFTTSLNDVANVIFDYRSRYDF